jgi:hypothetical protein
MDVRLLLKLEGPDFPGPLFCPHIGNRPAGAGGAPLRGHLVAGAWSLIRASRPSREGVAGRACPPSRS